MPRKRAKGAKPEQEPVDDSPLAFDGSIRSADESEGLDVVISTSGRYVVMRAGSAQLGKWLLTDVEIRRIDDTSFVFIAEEDELVFTPSDPSALAASRLVAEEVEGVKEGRSGRLRRRSVKKKPEVSSRNLPEGVVEDSVDPEVPEVASTPEAPVAESPPSGPRRGVRVRMLDAARHNNLFNLERVPIDEGLRGGEHEHSWEHRVATGSGLSSRVCTICGKIRFSKSS